MKLIRKFVGLLVAATYSIAYIATPIYLIACLVRLVLQPSSTSTYLFIAPALLSILLPPIPSYWLLSSWLFGCMRDYFDYEEIFEISDAQLVCSLKVSLVCLEASLD